MDEPLRPELNRTNTQLLLMEILFQLLRMPPFSNERSMEEALRRAGFTVDELAVRGVSVGKRENLSEE